MDFLVETYGAWIVNSAGGLRYLLRNKATLGDNRVRRSNPEISVILRKSLKTIRAGSDDVLYAVGCKELYFILRPFSEELLSTEIMRWFITAIEHNSDARIEALQECVQFQGVIRSSSRQGAAGEEYRISSGRSEEMPEYPGTAEFLKSQEAPIRLKSAFVSGFDLLATQIKKHSGWFKVLRASLKAQVAQAAGK